MSKEQSGWDRPALRCWPAWRRWPPNIPPIRLGSANGSFRPGQVLLYQGKISFIDFDSFCQAEPALFLSATKNIGLSEPHEEESNEDDAELAPETRAALLDQLDAICERFVIEF